MVDLAGHERYFKTTAYGLTGHLPDYACLIVGANAGASRAAALPSCSIVAVPAPKTLSGLLWPGAAWPRAFDGSTVLALATAATSSLATSCARRGRHVQGAPGCCARPEGPCVLPCHQGAHRQHSRCRTYPAAYVPCCVATHSDSICWRLSKRSGSHCPYTCRNACCTPHAGGHLPGARAETHAGVAAEHPEEARCAKRQNGTTMWLRISCRCLDNAVSSRHK